MALLYLTDGRVGSFYNFCNLYNLELHRRQRRRRSHGNQDATCVLHGKTNGEKQTLGV